MKEKLTFIDFETTGFAEKRAVSLALVHYENGRRVFEKYYLINPNTKIEQRAIEVHGITREQVSKQPSLDKIGSEIKYYIEGNLVVAHNASYDIRVLTRELERYNLECGKFRYTCTCNNAKALRLPVENHKLDTLCRYFDISLNNHHNALADPVACENIYFNLLKRNAVLSFSEYGGRYKAS